MQLFKTEIDDGLEEKINSTGSISYASLAIPTENTINNVKFTKSLASVDDKDLYYVQSILVSSSWNKNDDIFDKKEIWLAKNTPEDKPTNLEHDENLIIGHIVSNWPITEDGIVLDDNIDINNLPDIFHILTGSVIYKGFSNPELRERSNKLIAEIENGTKYVSMECFFKGFDYGLMDKETGEYKILARNDETAFLTKHLKSYGGLGEFQNHKVGRVLRDITFSGKGFVDKPANPDSIIFSKKIISSVCEQKNNDFSKNSVSIEQSQSEMENNIMSLELVEKNVAEIKDKIEAMTQCKAAIEEAQTTASNLESKNTELSQVLQAKEAELSDVKATLESVSLEKEEAAKKMAEEMKKKEEEMQKMKAEFDATNEILAAYKDKEAEMMKKEKKMNRTASLIETGLDTELATSTVEKFDGLDDASFDSMVEVFAAMMPKKKKMEEEEAMTMKKKASEESVDVEALETVETEETIDLSVGGDNEDSEAESTRAALVDFVYNRLGKKLNKGE